MKKRRVICPTCRQEVHKETAVISANLERERRAKRKQDRKSGKYDARRAVYWALRLGMIKKGPCADHGSTACQGKVEAHHHKGYTPDVWLDIVWVCRRHHQKREWEAPPSPKKHRT